MVTVLLFTSGWNWQRLADFPCLTIPGSNTVRDGAMWGPSSVVKIKPLFPAGIVHATSNTVVSIIRTNCDEGSSVNHTVGIIKTCVTIWCDFDRASSLICGNEMATRCNRDFYCRSYCLLNMFRAPLCSSSGAQDYYTVVAACGI